MNLYISYQFFSYCLFYKKLTFDLDISKSCIWQQWVDTEKKRELLNRCTGLIMPSLWEGFGIPALEAMACGTPVIGSTNGAMPEVLGDYGLIVNPLNISQIADAIMQIENNSEISQKLSVEGPKRASEFDWIKSIRDLEDLIKNL